MRRTNHSLKSLENFEHLSVDYRWYNLLDAQVPAVLLPQTLGMKNSLSFVCASPSQDFALQQVVRHLSCVNLIGVFVFCILSPVTTSMVSDCENDKNSQTATVPDTAGNTGDSWLSILCIHSPYSTQLNEIFWRVYFSIDNSVGPQGYESFCQLFREILYICTNVF